MYWLSFSHLNYSEPSCSVDLCSSQNVKLFFYVDTSWRKNSFIAVIKFFYQKKREYYQSLSLFGCTRKNRVRQCNFMKRILRNITYTMFQKSTHIYYLISLLLISVLERSLLWKFLFLFRKCKHVVIRIVNAINKNKISKRPIGSLVYRVRIRYMFHTINILDSLPQK